MTAERTNPFDIGDLIEPAKPAKPAAPQAAAAEKPIERPSRTQIDQLAKDTALFRASAAWAVGIRQVATATSI